MVNPAPRGEVSWPVDKLAGGLVADRHGPHVLIRHRDEQPAEQQLLATIPEMPGTLLVLASSRAHQQAALLRAIEFFLRSALSQGEGESSAYHAVWLGVATAATAKYADRELLCRLSKELSVDVLVPDGAFTGAPGCGLYAGQGTGATGWLRFQAGSEDGVVSTRCPIPSWEFVVPREPLTAIGLVADPVPAGLALRDARMAPAAAGDPAFRVAVNGKRPKLIVGRPDASAPAPVEVAALLKQFSPDLRSRWVLVPGHPAVAESSWISELAQRLAEPVLLNTGIEAAPEAGSRWTVTVGSRGEELFRPFATLVRQHPAEGEQKVLSTAPPPSGWKRAGARLYQLADGDVAVLAEVVPSGLVLRYADQPRDAPEEPFSPSGWTLWVGSKGRAVDQLQLAALQALIRGLRAEERRILRLRVVGELNPVGKAWLGQIAREGGLPGQPNRRPALQRQPIPARPGGYPPPVPPAGWPPRQQPQTMPPAPAPREPAGVRTTLRMAPVPPRPAPAPASPSPAQPVVTMSSTPVPTVSGGVPGASRPVQPAPLSEPPPLPPLPPAAADPIAPEDPPRTETAEHTETAAPTETEQPPAPVAEEPAPVPARLPGGRGAPLVLADRLSTPAEQTTLVAESGDAFNEALATVNAALATWPGLRQGDGAKADYVAVCLYFGRDDGAAGPVRESLRAAAPAAFEGYLPCLVSGIRRLPTHRRAVLRQARLSGPVEQRYAVGTMLTFPDFLTASVPLDVTVPDAELDMLIWPRSARRTSELGLGGPIDEAVFPAGPRFKSLAVRTAQGDAVAAEAPRTAVLVRELWPDEAPGTAELDDRDQAALAKLDRVWAQRLRCAIRTIDDPDLIARLTAPLLDAKEASERGGYVVKSLVGAGTAAVQP